MRLRLALAAGALALLVAAFVAGRYSAPVRIEERVKVETKTVTVTEWKDRVVVQRGPVRVRTVTHEVPGGERIVERVVERGPVTTTTDLTGTASAATESTSATRRVTEGGRPGFAVGLSAAWDPRALSLSPDRLGLELDRRIVGTVWLGLRASIHTPSTPDPRIGVAARLEW